MGDSLREIEQRLIPVHFVAHYLSRMQKPRATKLSTLNLIAQTKNPHPTGSLKQENNDADADNFQPIPRKDLNKKNAASVLMKRLYGARMGRFDLLRAINTLSEPLTESDSVCDQRLDRLMCYVWSTLEYRQIG